MIVHIGYHKTGSTYLQNKIFPYLKGVDFYSYTGDKDILEGISENAALDVEIDNYKAEIAKLQSKNLLYSNENLIGPLFYMTGLSKTDIAQNLKEIGFEKVIITIRNQYDMLDSIYRQYIMEGGVARFDFFIGDWRYSFNLKHLRFYRLIKYYHSLFDKDNVLVLLNEEMKQNEAETIKKIELFTGGKYVKPENTLDPKKANISISNGSIRLLRIFNHFVRSHHRPSNLLLPFAARTFYFRYLLQRFLDPYLISKFSSRKSFVAPDIRKHLHKKYAVSNAKLVKEFGLDLAKHNYPL